MEKVDVEARARKARELFMSGYNCSQSVFLAYADLYGIDPKLASTIVAPLGGGMGRLREVCGECCVHAYRVEVSQSFSGRQSG